MIALCETYQLYILNGIRNTAQYTCYTSRGNSVVDYILSNNYNYHITTDCDIASDLSDHALLSTHVPFGYYDYRLDRLD